MSDPDTSPPDRPSRAMQIVSVRFGTEQIALIQHEADKEGVSTSQFIRDRAWAGAVLAAARRNATSVVMFEKMIAIIEAAGHDALVGELRDFVENTAAIEDPLEDEDRVEDEDRIEDRQHHAA